MKKYTITLAVLALVGVQAQAIVRGAANGTSGLMNRPNPYAVDVRPTQAANESMHVLPVPIIGPEVTATAALETLKPVHIEDPKLKSALMDLHHEVAPLIEQAFNELTPAEKHHLKTVIDNIKTKAMVLKKFVKDKQNMPIVAMELIKVMAIIDRKKSELATKHIPSKELATGFIALQKASDAVKHVLIKFKKEMVKEGINPLTGIAGAHSAAMMRLASERTSSVGKVATRKKMLDNRSGSPVNRRVSPISHAYYQQALSDAQEYCAKEEGKASGESCSACIRAQLGRANIKDNDVPMGFDASCQVR